MGTGGGHGRAPDLAPGMGGIPPCRRMDPPSPLPPGYERARGLYTMPVTGGLPTGIRLTAQNPA